MFPAPRMATDFTWDVMVSIPIGRNATDADLDFRAASSLHCNPMKRLLRWWRVGAAAVLLSAHPPLADAGTASARYHEVAIPGEGSLARLRAALGESRFAEVLELNRVDAAHALRLGAFVLPDSAWPFLDLAPFPSTIPELESRDKVVLVSQRVQAFAAYEKGTLARWGPVCSGGRNSPTEPGLHFVNWKDRDHVSSVDPSWRMPWTVNIDDRVGTALHHYALPGRPASHCCIRLSEADAAWVYGWVDRGTPVVLFGDYDFESRPPWRNLPRDPGATTLGREEIRGVIEMLR
jgi:hypothetical protein